MNSWSPVDYLFYLSFVFFAFGISLFYKKGLIATKFLGIQFLGLAYQLFAGYFIQPSHINDYPHFFRTVSPFFYLLGPLAYLFQHYLLYPERKFRLVHLLHFLPFITCSWIYSLLYSPSRVKITRGKVRISTKYLL